MVSDIPTYWRWHRIHFSNLIIHWLLRLIVWYIIKALFVWILLNVLVLTIWILHKADFVCCLFILFWIPLEVLYGIRDWFAEWANSRLRLFICLEVFYLCFSCSYSLLYFAKKMFVRLNQPFTFEYPNYFY